MIYKTLRPLLFALPPETAHALTLAAVQTAGVVLPPARPDDSALQIRTAGLSFANPIGLAAGFDKDARAFQGILKLGFGFAEVGTLTPQPQKGNPRPRVFRDVRASALINRLGFNNGGAAAAQVRLARFRHKIKHTAPIGVNIGANRNNASDITASTTDYAQAASTFAGLADYLTLNISSPNTPHLRDLQTTESATRIMDATRAAAPDTPIFVKLAPELSSETALALAEAARQSGISGLILTNTTTAREGITITEEGGVSGAPLFGASTSLLSEIYRATNNNGNALTLIGVGGISTPEQAYAKIRAGASLLQLYTGLVYHGVGLIKQLKTGLHTLANQDGFSRLSDAIGADHK